MPGAVIARSEATAAIPIPRRHGMEIASLALGEKPGRFASLTGSGQAPAIGVTAAAMAGTRLGHDGRLFSLRGALEPKAGA